VNPAKQMHIDIHIKHFYEKNQGFKKCLCYGDNIKILPSSEYEVICLVIMYDCEYERKVNQLYHISATVLYSVAYSSLFKHF
jgi:hypothetical protein